MNSKRIKECTQLSEDILKNIELSELPIAQIVLKSLRLCRLLADEDGMRFFQYESSGYPKDEKGYLTSDAWRIGKLAGRHFFNEEGEERMFSDSLTVLEEDLISNKERLKIAKDPEAFSGDMSPLAINTSKNVQERNAIVGNIKRNTNRIGIVSGRIYDYILKINYQLQYGNIVEDIFSHTRYLVDIKLNSICPDSIKKFISVYENIGSVNDEDWANAVHSCRRILKDVADTLYPPCEDIEVNGKLIHLGKENYINRLIQFIESNNSCKTYEYVVSSNLKFVGERLDSINNAVCKGTHTHVERFEAERYVIYTYLLLGDVLSLYSDSVEASV